MTLSCAAKTISPLVKFQPVNKPYRRKPLPPIRPSTICPSGLQKTYTSLTRAPQDRLRKICGRSGAAP
jgi:hypothetical protein